MHLICERPSHLNCTQAKLNPTVSYLNLERTVHIYDNIFYDYVNIKKRAARMRVAPRACHLNWTLVTGVMESPPMTVVVSVDQLTPVGSGMEWSGTVVIRSSN